MEELEPQLQLHRVSSIGNYGSIEPRICVLDPRTATLVASLPVGVGDMTMCGERLYVCSSRWYGSGGENSFAVIDTRTRAVVEANFIKDGTDNSITTPYGVAVNPETEEIFVTDAQRFTSLGTLRCYDSGGILKWMATTGDGPSHIAFLEK